MTDDLMLNFPILKTHSGDFSDSVSYTVEATQAQNNRKLYIAHTLIGESYIAHLIKTKKAIFTVSLFYKDSSERHYFSCDEFEYDEDTQEITAEQEIEIEFSYAPEITPNIVVLDDERVIVDSKSGLVNFWNDEEFNIPAFSRIAHYLKLKFTSGDVSSLLNVSCEESYKDGSIRTIVTESAGEVEQPIRIACAQDVFDELKKGVTEVPIEAKTAMRASIVTQILCHVYAHMNNLDDKENEIHSGLLAHMEMVKERTGEDWEAESDFNPSFAATQMQPYAIKALNYEEKK